MIPNINYFNDLDSTQDEAKRIASISREWTVIVSNTQTKGRGKPGSLWYSPIGGLYLSIILKPTKDINDLLFITRITADVVISVLSKYGINAEIKLPNDVLVSGKKISGILIEKSQGALIVGVGLNINIAEFSTDLNATSMLLVTGKPTNRDALLGKFLEFFSEEYSKLVGNTI